MELMDAHLRRIEQVNPSLNAVAEVLSESAREAAARVDRQRAQGVPLGSLAGVPFSVKDSIEVKGTVCTAGTLGRQYAAPSREDATVVARLRAAGAIPLARTNLPDLLFAFESDNLIRGRTNNPYDLSRTSGGSSGGEAALIAAGGFAFGLGSDAAGSVRVPAHFCGIASIKPTSGRLPRTGHVPPAGGWIESLWQIGPMARRVEDLVRDALLAGPDGRDHTVIGMPYGDPDAVRIDAVDTQDLRVAFFTDNGVAPAEPGTVAAVRQVAAALASEVRLMEERRPPGVEESYDLEMGLLGPDGGDGLRAYPRWDREFANASAVGWMAGKTRIGAALLWRGLPDTGRIWTGSARKCSSFCKTTTRLCRPFAPMSPCRTGVRSRSTLSGIQLYDDL